MKKFILLVTMVLLSLVFCHWVLIEDCSPVLSKLTGIPDEVIGHALKQPEFTSLIVFGSLKEKHDFAHGKPTRFGQMPFDVDEYLQSKGWNDYDIHEKGSAFDFSNPKPGQRY